MTRRKIGFLGRLFGRGDTDCESASPVESDAADSGQAGPELAGPFFIRYVPGGPVKMLSRSADVSEIRTLDDGEVYKPQTYLEVPVAADVDALEIQVLLDELDGPDEDILDALETKSRCSEWSGLAPEEFSSLLADALDDLVSRGRCRVVESVITTPSGDVLRADGKEGARAETDTTQIFAVATRGDVRAVAAALDQGVDPNCRSDSSPLLHYPIMLDDADTADDRIDVVRLLLDRGADIEAADKNGWTALLAACQRGNERMIRLLLERGANPDVTDGKGWSAFHYLAANDAALDLFIVLAEAGTNANAQSGLDANTALMIAVNEASSQSVRALLNAGASAATTRNDRLTALHMAVAKGEIEIARMLLEADANVDQRGYGHGGAALHIAAGQGSLSMIDLLLEHGGDPSVADDNGHSALDVANGTGHFEAADRLIEALDS